MQRWQESTFNSCLTMSDKHLSSGPEASETLVDIYLGVHRYNTFYYSSTVFSYNNGDFQHLR